MIVVGGGAIALSTAQELCSLQGHRVVVLWRRDSDFAHAVEAIGAIFIAAARPDSSEGLERAGVRHAITILALSPDDQVNLHAALLARDANPRNPDRIAAIQPDPRPQDRAEPSELLGSVARLAFGCHLRRGRNRPVLLPRVAIPRTRRPAYRICRKECRRLWVGRRDRRACRAGAGGSARRDRWSDGLLAKLGSCGRSRARRVRRDCRLTGHRTPSIGGSGQTADRTSAVVPFSSRARSPSSAQPDPCQNSLSPHWLYSWSAPRISMPSLEVAGSTPSTSWLPR